MIRALPTTYGGKRFKSRTEARWALYFDLMGVEWRYEDEAYSLPSGPYLPDFWLPRNRVYAEVKGDAGFDWDSMVKVSELCAVSGRSVLLLDGPPAATLYVRTSFDYEEEGTPGFLASSGFFTGDRIAGDAFGGRIAMGHAHLPVDDTKDRFRNGGEWWEIGGEELGYGSEWIGAMHPARSWFHKGTPTYEAVEIVRNASTTRWGELVVGSPRSVAPASAGRSRVAALTARLPEEVAR